MATVREGHRPVLLVVDVQVGVMAEAVIRDLNTAMTWLRYPGRGNAAMPAEQVDFASAPAALAR